MGTATLTKDQQNWLVHGFKVCHSCFLGLSNLLGKILFLKWKVRQTYTGKVWTDYINTVKLVARFRQNFLWTLLTGQSVNPTLIDRTSLRAPNGLLQQSHYNDWFKQSLLKWSDGMFNQVMCNKAKQSGFKN